MLNLQPSFPGYEQHRTAAVPSVAQIKREVADYFGLKPLDMVSARRARRVARPRQIAMYLAREHTLFSMPAIGGFFGGRDHTTVMHACRQVERLLGEDEGFARDVAELEGRL